MPQLFRMPRIARMEPRPISRSVLRPPAGRAGDPARRLGYRAPARQSVPRALETRAEESHIARSSEVADRRAPSRLATGLLTLGAGILTVLGCKTYEPPQAVSDVPVSVVDAGIADVTAEAEISAAVAAPVTRIYGAGVLAEALRVSQATEVSFPLPQELKDLFGQVKFFGIIGPRMDRNNRSPFSVAGFAEQDGTVTASITALRGAFSSEEGAINDWHLVLELGEGEAAKYCWYGLTVQGGSNNNNRRDAGPRRDTSDRRDAGTTSPADATIRDIARGETRPRI